MERVLPGNLRVTQPIWSIPRRAQKGDRNVATRTTSSFFENTGDESLLLN